MSFIKIGFKHLEDRNIDLAMIRALSENFKPAGTYFLAGGAYNCVLTGQKVKDYDFFMGPNASVEDFEAALKAFDPGYKKTREHERFNDYTKSDKEPKIQLVKFLNHQTIEECIGRFDFTVAQFGLKIGDTEVTTTANALLDLARKRLVLNNLAHPTSTIRRLMRYKDKGFTVCNGVIQQIVKKISNMNKNELEEAEKIAYID